MAQQTKKAALATRPSPNVSSSPPTAGTFTAKSPSGASRTDPSASSFDWRKHLAVHPAAELLPALLDAELRALADDIKANGLHTNIVVWSPANPDDKYEVLLDGRHRLDALALLGLLCVDEAGHLCTTKRWLRDRGWSDDGAPERLHRQYIEGGDPYALALSYNVHRRHLTAEQKRDLIAKLLKAKPEASNLAIAKQVRVATDKTVAKVRADLEARSEIPNVEARTDAKGRKQPASKPKRAKPGPVTTNNGAATEEPVEAIAATEPTETTPKPRVATTPKPRVAKTVSPKDIALLDFTARVLDLVRRIAKYEPARFADTAVKADDLARLSKFFADLVVLKSREVAS
jgi:hypothetical protein